MPRIHPLNWAGLGVGLFGGLALWLSHCPWRICTAPQQPSAVIR